MGLLRRPKAWCPTDVNLHPQWRGLILLKRWAGEELLFKTKDTETKEHCSLSYIIKCNNLFSLSTYGKYLWIWLQKWSLVFKIISIKGSYACKSLFWPLRCLFELIITGLWWSVLGFRYSYHVFPINMFELLLKFFQKVMHNWYQNVRSLDWGMLVFWWTKMPKCQGNPRRVGTVSEGHWFLHGENRQRCGGGGWSWVLRTRTLRWAAVPMAQFWNTKPSHWSRLWRCYSCGDAQGDCGSALEKQNLISLTKC